MHRTNMFSYIIDGLVHPATYLMHASHPGKTPCIQEIIFDFHKPASCKATPLFGFRQRATENDEGFDEW